MSSITVPTLAIRSGLSDHHSMPVIGLGTAASPPPEPTVLKEAVMDAIKLGYRHFDTSPRYQTEEPLGEALADAISLGLVRSRSELFVTTKLWCADAHTGLVVPAIQRSLKNLKLDYLDLYLIHWPVSSKPGKYKFPIDEDDFLPMDFEAVWSEMEECHRLGLAKCIGVSNFSCKKLQHILSIAKIPPSVNQVEMSPIWQQRKLRELCKENDIVVTAYSVLGSRGAFWGTHKIMESDVLKEIAEAKEKTVAQVSMRWTYEEGVSMVVKSFTKERLEENLKIFDWSLTHMETQRISTEIPQFRNLGGEVYISKKGPIKSVAEMWDALSFAIGSVSHLMPVLALGTAASPPPEPMVLKQTVLEAIKLGYRHFDTSPRYQTEEPLGEALAEAVCQGLVQSRSELFVTSKLWCADAHGGLVLPAIQRSLKNLKLDYLDLYLIHWPVSSKPGKYKFPIEEDDFLPMDYEAVWSEMEECQRLGAAKCIGVSNFSCKKLEHILSIAKIPPSVNQVEMSPVWQQRKLREFCKSKGIVVTAYSILGSRGAFWGTHKIMESDVLKEIAEAKGKTVAQVSLRWAYEEGVSMVVKSFTKERLEENLKIFDWSLTEEEKQRISTEISQCRIVDGEVYISEKGPIKSVTEMWDGEI